MQPLRIGLFAPYDLARAGGVNSHLRAQARALRHLGHDVRIYGPASAPLPGVGEAALSGSVAVTFGGTESGLGLDPRGRPRVIRLFRSQPFDIVHVHEPLVPLLPWFVIACAPSRIVATFHVHRERGHRWYPFARPWLQSLMRRVHARIAVSEPARRTVAAHFPGDYEIVPNAIDVDTFSAPRPRPPIMDSDRQQVLFVGRLERRKGVDRLIRAMADLKPVAPRARLIVVGEGPDRKALEALAGSTGADVTFAGRVSDEALPAYFQAADLVCSPAIGGESFGIVLLEAMAAGRPVVATRIEGYAEWLADSGCARLVDSDDAGALTRTLASLLEDPDLRRRLGDRARVFARDYDWSVVARRLERIYERVRQAASCRSSSTTT